jgi:alkylation response protein AidB-like acyl-CoA dehydrogenase
MDFELSEEQAAIAELATQIAAQVTPERLKEVEAGPEWFDRALWSDLANANLLGVALPSAHGGSGFGLLELCLLLEALGRVTARVPAVPTLVSGARTIATHGSDALQARLLPGVVAGDVVLSAALVGEAQAAADGDGWRVTGATTCVPAADLADAVLVPATTDRGVVVAAIDVGGEGVTLTRQRSTSGAPEFAVDLDGAPVAASDVMAGGRVADALVETTLVGLCAVQAGVIERALRLTAEYTTGREQFGRAIATFQAVGQRAADAYIDVEAARLTMLEAAWRLDEGLAAGDAVAVAKFWAAEAGQRVSAAAQHLHGGIGVDVDYPLHRHSLLAKQIELSLGGATQQLVRLGASMAAAAGARS